MGHSRDSKGGSHHEKIPDNAGNTGIESQDFRICFSVSYTGVHFWMGVLWFDAYV